MNHYLSRAEARDCINQWGKAAEPFLFFCDYDAERFFVHPLRHLRQDKLLFHFPQAANDQAFPAKELREAWQVEPPSFDEYRFAFDHVCHHLLQGNSYLVNLTFRSPVQTSLSLLDVYQAAQAPYKLYVPGQFVCFSPEIFVRISAQGRISSYPMKGSIAAGLPHARRLLLDNAKEAAEHATIVDLIRNDLSQVARSVRVSRYRYVDRIENRRGGLLATSSCVEGQLDVGWQAQLADVLLPLLPAGSITGAPKRATCRIIAEAEPVARGFYTGVCGVFDGRQLDSAVMIRFVAQEERGALYFHSGGGITARSDAQQEYEELILKTDVPLCRNH